MSGTLTHKDRCCPWSVVSHVNVGHQEVSYDATSFNGQGCELAIGLKEAHELGKIQ
jgi:hypothetical protein